MNYLSQYYPCHYFLLYSRCKPSILHPHTLVITNRIIIKMINATMNIRITVAMIVTNHVTSRKPVNSLMNFVPGIHFFNKYHKINRNHGIIKIDWIFLKTNNINSLVSKWRIDLYFYLVLFYYCISWWVCYLLTSSFFTVWKNFFTLLPYFFNHFFSSLHFFLQR